MRSATETVAAVVRRVGRRLHGLYAAAGLVLSAGLALAAAGLWGLSRLTENVLDGETARADEAVLVWLNGHATPWLDRLAVEVTVLGDTQVLALTAVVAGAMLWLLGRRAYAAILVVAVAGGGVITPVLKAIFDRPRPQVFEWRAHFPEVSASYPSGHATMTMVTLVAVAFIIHRLARRRAVSIAAAALAGLIILLVGVSRMYLGLHFPSDILAGYAIGFAWAILAALTVEVA